MENKGIDSVPLSRGGRMVTVLLVVLIAVAVIFSVQNASPVALSFLSWHFEASLAVVILLTLVTGMIIGMAILSWSRMRRSMRKKKEQRGEKSGSSMPS
jgi:putative membrane protein